MDTPNFQFHHPVGDLHGLFTARGLRALHLPHPDKPHTARTLQEPPNAALAQRLHGALEAYFAGTPESFNGIELDFGDATPFQIAVWQAARTVPHGATCTYGALATRLGKPVSAARAVGAALGANPLAILVPCHRFLAANGHLTGFAAGLEWKRRLLSLEGAALL